MVCNTWMAEPGSVCCSVDRQSLPMAHRVTFTLHRTEQLFVPSTVCKVTHPSYLVPRGREGVWYQW